MVEVAKGVLDTEVEEFPDYGTSVITESRVVVSRCPRCDNLTLYTHLASNTFDNSNFRVLYPRARDLSGLPQTVQIEYDRAQKAKLVDRGFYALALRRVLEAICSYKGAQGGNLYQKLKYLVDTKSLPEQFAELAHYLREIGNVGAHVGDIEILESDVEAATDFIEAILEYLYIAPAKLKRVTDELEARKNPPKGIESP